MQDLSYAGPMLLGLTPMIAFLPIVVVAYGGQSPVPAIRHHEGRGHRPRPGYRAEVIVSHNG